MNRRAYRTGGSQRGKMIRASVRASMSIAEYLIPALTHFALLSRLSTTFSPTEYILTSLYILSSLNPPFRFSSHSLASSSVKAPDFTSRLLSHADFLLLALCYHLVSVLPYYSPFPWIICFASPIFRFSLFSSFSLVFFRFSFSSSFSLCSFLSTPPIHIFG